MTRFRPYLLLALLWLLYFHPLALDPAGTLFAPNSDFLAQHLPAKLFLNREWRATGELPLWNPYHFCGSPFVHDVQVGAFYPPYAVALLVPEGAVGAVLSWAVALHLLAAGWGALAYARAHGLNEPGALVAATGFMLSSKWLTHLLLAGHTVTVGLVWLPPLLLLAERAIEARGAWAVAKVGAVLALLGLGTHPQWAVYAGLFAAAWTARRGHLARWARVWAGAGAVAAVLAAVQLFPALEAARWSARAGGVDASGALVIGPRAALALVGPSFGYEPPHSWEARGVFGLFWLAAAVAAPLVVPHLRYRAGVALALVLFAVGGAALVEWLPGFNLFRVPARMLLVAAFPLAFLAGATTHALTASGWALGPRAAAARGFRLALFAAGVPTLLGLRFFAAGPEWAPFVLYWAAAVVALPLLIRALGNGPTSARARTALWGAILLADLLAPVARLVRVRPQAELYPVSPLYGPLAERPGAVRVLDWDAGGPGALAAFLGVGAPQALVRGVPAVRGYNPLDVRHYREFLAFVVNDNRPVRGNGPYAQQVLPNFVVGNPELFRQLAVTHRVAPEGAPAPPGAWAVVAREAAPAAPPPLLPDSPDPLPPHALTAVADAPPRARVVPRAARMPDGDELPALKAADLSNTVLVRGAFESEPAGGRPGAARVVALSANRVSVELDGTAGWLVLAEVWFPGWRCTVDGAEVEVRRANHAFRAVPVPAGARRAEFVFAPRSYAVGWWVSASALAALAVCAAGRRLVGRGHSDGPRYTNGAQ